MRRSAVIRLYQAYTATASNSFGQGGSCISTRRLSQEACLASAPPSAGRVAWGASATAVVAAGFGLACWASQGRSIGKDGAHCAAEIPLTTANAKGDQFLDDFRRWLQQHGFDMQAIEIRPCDEVSNHYCRYAQHFCDSICYLKYRHTSVFRGTCALWRKHVTHFTGLILSTMQASRAGLGVYASEQVKDKFRRSWRAWAASWFWSSRDVVLARFPLQSTVTARTITADDKLGNAYKQLLDTGSVLCLHIPCIMGNTA